MPAQSSMAILYGFLDVLRVMVNAADDDQVLDSARDVKLAILIEKAEIAGAQPALATAGHHPSPEHRTGRLGVAPITRRDMRPGNPNFADQCRS